MTFAGKAFARALTLPERYFPAPVVQPAPEAAERLARWRQQPPFSQERWWQARLATAGITESGLLAVLGDGEAARPDLPDWAADFATAMQADVPRDDAGGDDAGDGGAGGGGGGGGALFAPVVTALLAAARADLRDRLRALGGARFDPDQLARLLCAQLPQIMHEMLLRTLVLELHKSRVAGELAGNSPTARFASFTARFATTLDAARHSSPTTRCWPGSWQSRYGPG
jgi:hypothetical protein